MKNCKAAIVFFVLLPVYAFAQTGSEAAGESVPIEEILSEAQESVRVLKEELDDLEARRAALLEQITAIENRLAELPAAQAGEDSTAVVVQDASLDADISSSEPADSVAGGLAYTPPLAGEGRRSQFDDADFPKSVPLFGSDWRFSFGGYAKADLIRDFSGSGDETQFVLAEIPVNGNPQPGSYSHYQMRETRFHFDVRDVSAQRPDSRFFLEFDFFDLSNELTPRLRHAYFQYGKLLVGQTWTTMTELRQLPLIIDFAAGDSILGGRTKQVRWVGDEDGRPWTWSVAAESFDDTSIANPYDADGIARANWPRFVGAVSRPWDGGLITAGAAAAQLRFDGAESQPNSTKWTYTATVAGRLYLDASNEAYLGAGVGYSSGGITDIITFANGRVPNAVLDQSGELQLLEGWNTQIGFHWPWNARWSSNISYAYARLTTIPGDLDPDLIREGWAGHANLIYTHDERLRAGFEYMYGYRENIDAQDGDAHRVQLSLFYYF